MSYPYYIIGGGIIGLLTARELLLAGRQVVLLERNPLIGRESSWAGGGILSPLYPWRYADSITELAAYSQQAYPLLCAELAATGSDPEWIQSGLLVIGPNDIEKALKWQKNTRTTLNVIDSQELLTRVPGLADNGVAAIDMPEIAQVRNPRLIAALKQWLTNEGAMFRRQTEVTGFSVDQTGLVGLQTSAGMIDTDRCIVAAGAWTGRLLASMGINLGIEPVRGQMLVFNGKPGLLPHILLKNDRYLIPRQDGRILVGSTLEYTGFDKSITEQAANDLHAAARDIYPILDTLPIETQWAGLRPGSADNVPYIGVHPDINGLAVCAGHFRNGFVLGPASARLVTDIMLDRRPFISPIPYDLRRRRQSPLLADH